MHFGLFNLMTQREKGKSPALIYRETAEHVKMAERIGIEIAWFAEHHFSNYCLCPSPLALVNWMAGQTSRIRLGPAVIVAPLYEPIRLMEEIGLADQLSDGRLVLGFGTGYQAYEFHKFGRDLKQARAALFEVLDLAESYLARESFAFDGAGVKLPETAFSVRTAQSRPEIYLAGMGTDPEAQRRVAERGYVPFVTTGWNPISAISGVRDATAATWKNLGADPAGMPFAIQRYVCVTDSRDEALRAADGARYVRRIAQAMRGGYGELEGAFLREMPAEGEPPLEEIVERLPIGDAETVAERLARDIETLNPDHISLFMGIPGLEQRQVLRSMDRFGAEVLPLLRSRFGDLGALGVRGAAGRQGATPQPAMAESASG